MNGLDQLVPLEVGEPVRDVVTGKEGDVLWVGTDAGRTAVLVRWVDGDRSAYGAEEIGSRLVRWSR